MKTSLPAPLTRIATPKPRRRPEITDPLSAHARQRRIYTDFLALCLYPGMTRPPEPVSPAGRSAA